ncbi:MAG: Hsp70 family protein [Solirubrobacteraceae bacterium]
MASDQGWILAIDFGTTATAAATVSGGEVRLVRIEADDRMPSMVFWREGEKGREGELYLGELADRWAALAPECLERAPKRRIGDQYLVLGTARIPVAHAVSAVLAKVRDAAVRERGGAPSQLYLTHPARWAVDGPEVEQLREAARMAGLPEPVLVAEPVAAAIYFASEELSVGQFVAVYDFGGGTFDTAVLQRVADGFEVVGEPGGDEDLGGEDFDDRLYRWLGSQLPAEDWQNLRTSRTGGWPQTNRQLLREARKAKEHLSRNPDAPVYVPAPVDRDILVNVAELRTLIADDIEATVEELARTIQGAGLAPDQLEAIYLAGGSSAIPLVGSLISERLGKVPRTLDDPKTVVARGAALAALHAQAQEPPRQAAPPVTGTATPTPGSATPAPDLEKPALGSATPPPAGAVDDRTELDLGEEQAPEPDWVPAPTRTPEPEPVRAAEAEPERTAKPEPERTPKRDQTPKREPAAVIALLSRLTAQQKLIGGLLLAVIIVGGYALFSGGSGPGPTPPPTNSGNGGGGGSTSTVSNVSTYSATMTSEIDDSCLADSPSSYCTCITQGTENAVPYSTFEADLPDIRDQNYPSWYVGVVDTCRSSASSSSSGSGT